jgi:hypothetical protein
MSPAKLSMPLICLPRSARRKGFFVNFVGFVVLKNNFTLFDQDLLS